MTINWVRWYCNYDRPKVAPVKVVRLGVSRSTISRCMCTVIWFCTWLVSDYHTMVINMTLRLYFGLSHFAIHHRKFSFWWTPGFSVFVIPFGLYWIVHQVQCIHFTRASISIHNYANYHELITIYTTLSDLLSWSSAWIFLSRRRHPLKNNFTIKRGWTKTRAPSST